MDAGYAPCVVVTGPESTGKSTLVAALAHRLGGTGVAEYARQALEGRQRYDRADVCRMALVQSRMLHHMQTSAKGIIWADTDLLTYRVWMEERYGACPEWLRLLHLRQRPAVYLLCAPDLPWAPDPLREHPHDRPRLFERYRALLEEDRQTYTVVAGTGESRLEHALSALRHLADTGAVSPSLRPFIDLNA